MKDLLTAVSKKSYIGRTLRNVIIAFVIVYVMIMSALLPVSTLYFEARAKEEDAFVGVMLEEGSIPIEEPTEEVLDEERDRTKSHSYIKKGSMGGDITRVAEDESARTLFSKEYIMSDGSRTVEQYAQPIHYVDNGVYKDIDNTLIEIGIKGKTIIENKANFFKTKFSKDSNDDSAVEIKLNRHSFKWSLRMSKEKNIVSEKLSNRAKIGKVKYQNLYNDIDIEYSVHSLQVKEDIILYKQQNKNSFYYEIETENLILKLQEEGNITCKDMLTAEQVMTIPKAFMVDANDTISYDIEYQLDDCGNGKYILRVLPNEDWLKSAERKYPVTIDPQINFNSNAQGLYSLSDNVDYSSTLRTVSKDVWSYIYFPISSIPAEATITSSTVSFAYMGVNSGSDMIHAYQALANWKDQTTGSTRNHALGMGNSDDNTIGAFITAFLLMFPMASVPFENTLDGALSLDVTNMVRGWHQGDFENNGIILYTGLNQTSEEDTTGVFFVREGESDTSLRVTINYRINIGLEDYWTYDSFNVGRAGSGFINQFNNQLTFVHNTVSLGGELPITLSHIYNDAWVDSYYNVGNLYENMKVGTGWKLNYQQAILPIEEYDPYNTDDRYKFVYIDADGTIHRFWQEDTSSPIIDEDGLGYSLTIDTQSTNAYYTLTDVNKNKLKFYNTGRLYRLEDSNGNYNEIVYDESYRIVEIKDRVGRKIKLEYLSNNFLIKIYYDLNALSDTAENEVYNKFVQLEYVGATVYKFLYNDGKKSFYSYENGRTGQMIEIYNFDGYTIRFDFSARTEDGNVISARKISEYITTIPETGPFEATVTTDKTGSTRELLFYHGKTEIVEPKSGSAFVAYTDDTADTYRTSNLFSTIVFDVYGRAINSYSFIKNELVSNAYFYDGMQVPTAVSTDVLDEAEESTGDTTIGGETESINSGALDTNKLTMSSYYSAEVKNYLSNPSFENGWAGWSSTQSSATPKCRVVVNSYKPLFGKKALVMMLTQVAPQVLSAQQTVDLEAGTYTLSGYIRLDGNLHRYGTGSFGAYLQASYGDTVKNTEKITTETISVNSGYRLVSVTFTLSEAQTIMVKAILENCATFAWFDGLQLIKGNAPSYVSYNMLNNGDFASYADGTFDGWTMLNVSESGSISQNTALGSRDISADGSALSIHNLVTGGYLSVYQDVYLNKNSSKNYVLSAWSKSQQTNDGHADAMFGIAVENLSTEEVYFMPFDKKVCYWQQAVLPFSINSSGEVRIHILYSECIGFATFDNVCLTASDTTSYRYNEYGILESGVGTDGNEYKTTITDNGTTITRTLTVGTVETILEETKRDNNYNVISSSNMLSGVQNSFAYDSYGNVTESIVQNYTTSSTGAQIVNTVNYGEFTEEFQQMITDTDSRGFQAISTYDGMLGVLNKTTFADDSYKTYGYDATTELLNGVGVMSSDGTTTDAIYYTYDDNYRLTQVRYKAQRFVYTYDEWGRITTVSGYKMGGTYNIVLIKNTYNTYGGTLKSSINSIFGYTENYSYDIYGNLTSITTSDGRTGSWTYNASGQLVKSNDEEGAVLYQYDGLGRLVVASTRSSTAEISRQVEEYKYDTKNRLSSKTLYLKARDEEAHPESQDLLASSASLTTTYTGNNIFRMWNWGIIRVRYDYSGGRTSRENNQWLDTSTHAGGETVLYTRDSYGNLLYKTYYPYTTGDVGSAIRVVYPQYTVETTTYTYQNADDSATIKKISWGDGYYENYGYDELQRVNSKDILNSSGTTVVNEDYTFLSGRTDKENSTTTFVHTKTVNGITFTMSYDSLGRITEIADSRYTNPVKYYYDIYGSLCREDNPYSNQTIVYVIDNYEIKRGVRYYSYTNEETLGDPISTITYTFSSGMLIGDSVNGNQHIINNTKLLYTTYNRTDLTWSGNILSQYGNIKYLYDINGLRCAKINGSSGTSYFREGDTLIRQKNSATDIWFYYDNAGAIEGIKYNGTRYFYLTNPLGDVIGIIDTSGNVVVTYTYDAWGNILSTSGTLSSTLGVDNPIRYRGYYYDVESGFYYLNSRYYDPRYGQFISIDSVESGDLFGYCDNNPVNAVDRTGQWVDTALDVVSLGFSVYDMVKDPSWENAGWLALDVVCLAVPFMSGAGALKFISKGDDLVDAVRVVDKLDDVMDTGRGVSHISEFAEGAKWADEAIDIYRQGDNFSDARRIANSTQVGSYDILFQSNIHYIGKGSQKRAFVSASTKANKFNDTIVSIKWKPAASDAQAFIDEANRMAFYAKSWTAKISDVNNLYNRIWSPGKKLLGK